jgi:hypothetical protein
MAKRLTASKRTTGKRGGLAKMEKAWARKQTAKGKRG